MNGGMGGLGGFDAGNALGAIGMALLSSPRNNPLQNLPQFIGEANKNAERGYQVKAMEEALVAAGIPRSEAQVMARSPEAAKIRLQTLSQQKGEAASRGVIDTLRETYGLPSAAPATPAAPRPTAPAIGPRSDAGGGNPELAAAIQKHATAAGLDPVDLATAMSYETAGTFDPWKAGPTTKWGQHRGLIQWGEPQRQQYGVDETTPVEQQVAASVKYLQDRGVKPGHGLMEIYSAINAGGVGPQYYGRSDAAAGGAPGTVADKVNNQMAGHRAKAEALLAGLGQARPVRVASADAGFAPQPDGISAPSPAMQRVLDEAKARGLTQGEPQAAPAPADWRSAQASPEEFEAQLARARGDTAGLSIAPAPAAPVQAPVVSPAPSLPANAPMPPARPQGLGMGPSAGIDPNSNDAGAKAFAASGMGRGPMLSPPPAMALGQGSAPAVTSPVAPLPAPPPAPPMPAPPPRAADLPVAGGAPVQAQADPRLVAAAERKVEAVAASGPTRMPSEFQGKTQKSLAEQHFQKALKLELAAATPHLPENTAKTVRELAKYHFDISKEFLKPSDIDRQIDRLDVSEAEKQTIRRNAIKDARPSEVQEFEYARNDPGFLKYQKELAEAKRSQVNIDQRAESVENQERGKGLAKNLNEAAGDYADATKDVAVVQRLDALLKDANPGLGAGLVEEIRRRTGIALSPNADKYQAVNSLVEYLVPRQRVEGSGTSTDRDMVSFRAALPSLLGTPGGNQVAVQTLGGLATFRQERAKIASDWQVGDITSKEAVSRIRALPDPFEAFRSFQAGPGEKKAEPGQATKSKTGAVPPGAPTATGPNGEKVYLNPQTNQWEAVPK